MLFGRLFVRGRWALCVWGFWGLGLGLLFGKAGWDWGLWCFLGRAGVIGGGFGMVSCIYKLTASFSARMTYDLDAFFGMRKRRYALDEANRIGALLV